MKSRILILNSQSGKNLPGKTALKVATQDATVVETDKVSEALELISKPDSFLIIISNEGTPELFEAARKHQQSARTVFMTDMTMEQYSPALLGNEHMLIDHVIANRFPSDWTVNELRTTIQKILRKDLFGLEKYLMPHSEIFHRVVSGSPSRPVLNKEVSQFAQNLGLNSHLTKNIFGISEELLMNAIYDAPSAAGKVPKESVPGDKSYLLPEEHRGIFSFGCDGKTFALSVSDPFGVFERDIFFKYVKKVLHRTDSAKLLDDKASGAGLGLFKVLYSAHTLVCNVEKGNKTEMIALIDISMQIRDFSKMPRSIHYFIV